MKSKGNRFVSIFLKTAAVVFFVVFLSGAAVAASGPYGRIPPRQQFEKMREKINTLRIWKLTRVLNLNEDSASRVFPILNKYDRRRADIEYNQRVAMRNLRMALANRDDARLQTVLDNLEANHEALERINGSERAELKKVLTVEQQAKFLLFQVRFNNQIKKMISEARGKRLQGGRPFAESPAQ